MMAGCHYQALQLMIIEYIKLLKKNSPMANYVIVGGSVEIGSQLTEYFKGKGHTLLLGKHKNTVDK